MGRVHHLGVTPRVPVARFTMADGSVSAGYVVPLEFEIPDGVIAVEIGQLPSFPADWPAAEDPSWLNDGLPPPPAAPEVRGPGRFRPPSGT